MRQKNGDIFLFYCEQYGVKSRKGGVFYRKSRDDGLTWGEAVNISDSCLPEYHSVIAVGPTHGIETSDGTYIVPVWMVPASAKVRKTSHHPSVVSVLYSKDFGNSWHMGDIIEKGIVNPSETVAVELSDGKIMLNMRNESGYKQRAFTVSQNGYSGWSAVEYDKTLIEPVCNAALVKGNSGELIFVNPESVSKRKNATVKVSFDNGKTWKAKKQLNSKNSAYSDAAVTDDGTIHVLLETSPGMSISYYRFTLDWVKSGKDI